VRIRAECRLHGRTGVEMEALTAPGGGAHRLRMQGGGQGHGRRWRALLEKRGGRSGLAAEA
jgi:hypothetical protein